ncbi:MAG: AAA family ATPase [Elusimicrobia bacterium]|nr:AAA family ATPase [Elusimicrobiota bacterium]
MKAARRPKKGMTIILYGKGGIGKTTVSSHLAAHFARSGKRVLLLGCDPKADTSTRFLSGRRPPTIIDMVGGRVEKKFEDLLTRTEAGVDVMETGGPEPGVGCGGRGVATLCQFLEGHGLELSGYDVTIFDVLGDLVCGGFVAPLRFGSGNCLFIVSSEEAASLFAANNIARMAARPFGPPISAGGLILNLRDNSAPRRALAEFAARLHIPIAGVIARDKVITEAEEKGQTVISYAPRSRAAAQFAAVAAAIAKRVAAPAGKAITPMSNEAFWAFIRARRMSSL